MTLVKSVVSGVPDLLAAKTVYMRALAQRVGALILLLETTKLAGS